MKKWIKCAIAATALFTLAGCGSDKPFSAANRAPSNNPPDTRLSVLYAGSMTASMEKQIGPSYTKLTGIRYEGQGAGSNALAQMIRSGLRTPDIFISASPSVNRSLLMGNANKNLVQWYLTFARDELVIAYNPRSKFAGQLQAAAAGRTPWYQVLEQPGFLLGRTDPKLDPKGANTVLMFELAAKLYRQPNLADRLMGGSIENTAQVYPEETLIARLNTGQLDAAIAYRHEAVDWHMPYVSLPADINLGDPVKAKWYASVSVSTGRGKVVKGAPIVFTITIPATAKNEQGAEPFVRYMVTGEGHDILMRSGFSATPAYLSGSADAMPPGLRSLVQGTLN